MEDIALAALPRDVESDAESEASSGRTTPSLKSETVLASLLDDGKYLKLPEVTLSPFAELTAKTPKVQGVTLPSFAELTGKIVRPHLEGAGRRSQIPTLPDVDVNTLAGLRCKVYERRNDDWHDRGTGRCVCTVEGTYTPRVLVRSEDNPSFRLIDLRPTTDHGFNKQQDTLLVWKELDGTDMALSFQEPEGCDDCWIFLNRWCPKLDFESIIGPGLNDDPSHTASSHWTISERAEFRGHVEYYGTNWAAIADVMGTKTTTMLEDHYFQLLSEGDTELQKLAVESDRKRHDTDSNHTSTKQLREELEEKELRIVQLEQAFMALQQGGQTNLALPVLQFVPDHRPPQLAELSDVEWLRKEHAKAESRLRQLQQTVMDLQTARSQQSPQAIVEEYACEDCRQVFPNAGDLSWHKATHYPHTRSSLSGSGETKRYVQPSSLPNQPIVPVNDESLTASTGRSILPSESFGLPSFHLPSFPLPVPPSFPYSSSHDHNEHPLMVSQQSPDLGPIQLPPLKKVGIIKCICELTYDDGNTVLCEECDTWQHIICYYVSVFHVPDVHECADCRPRPVDAEAANERQTKRRDIRVAAHGEHECTECGQAFTRVNDLQRHWNLHEPKSPSGRHTLEPSSRPLNPAHPLVSLKHPPKELGQRPPEEPPHRSMTERLREQQAREQQAQAQAQAQHHHAAINRGKPQDKDCVLPESNNEVLPWIVKGYNSTFLKTEKSHENSFLSSNLSGRESKAKQADPGAGGAGAKRKYRRHPKPDEYAPERPPSAYVFFTKQVRESLNEQDLSFTGFAKAVGERWQKCPADKRDACEQQARKAKEDYDANLAEYKKTPQFEAYQRYLEDFRAQARRSNIEQLHTVGEAYLGSDSTNTMSEFSAEINERHESVKLQGQEDGVIDASSTGPPPEQDWNRNEINQFNNEEDIEPVQPREEC
jgi:hypothetical protein